MRLLSGVEMRNRAGGRYAMVEEYALLCILDAMPLWCLPSS